MNNTGKIFFGIVGLGLMVKGVKKIKDNIVERRKERNAFLHGKEVEKNDGSFWFHKGPVEGNIENMRKTAASENAHMI